jgi:hypothetical protein
VRWRASLSDTLDKRTCSLGNTDSVIGPSSTSVRWYSVFTQSVAKPLN